MNPCNTPSFLLHVLFIRKNCQALSTAYQIDLKQAVQELMHGK